ncbi:CRISPR-associated endonuclease Cas1 [Calditrichota bacterium LG25]
MPTVYVAADKARLTKSGQTLVLKYEDGTQRVIYPFRTEQLVLIGNIDITTPALKLLMHHEIDTVFLNKNGRYNGKLTFNRGKNIFLRLRQFRLLDDEKFSLQMARAIAAGKIRNQLVFAQRIRRERKAPEVTQAIAQMNDLLKKAQEADRKERLRGLEGSAAHLYFSIYKYAFLVDWADFPGRSMNPPKSNVNAVLSFLYTLIKNRVEAALETEGLDPYASFFHALNYGKVGLAFDMMEEFRVPLSDMLTASLFNLGILDAEDFREVNFRSDDDEFPLEMEIVKEGDEPQILPRSSVGILLTKKGLTKVITHFEKRLETEIMHPWAERRMSYKQIIRYQARHLRRVISGEEQYYQPFGIR